MLCRLTSVAQLRATLTRADPPGPSLAIILRPGRVGQPLGPSVCSHLLGAAAHALAQSPLLADT